MPGSFINSGQHIWGHVGVSKQPYGVASPRLGRNVADQAVWDSFVVTQGGRMGVNELCPAPAVPAGQKLQDVIAQKVREKQAARGADLTQFSTDQVLTLNQYLGYDLNTVEFAIRDGVPLAIDFCNPAPDAEAASVGQANFEWVVDAVSDMAIRKAKEHQPGRDNLSWGKFIQAAVTKKSLGDLA